MNKYMNTIIPVINCGNEIDALKRIEVIKPHRDENGQAVISRDLAEGWDAWDAS